MPRPTKPSLSCDMVVILFEVIDCIVQGCGTAKANYLARAEPYS